MNAFQRVLTTPVFRMLSANIGLMGCINASVYPYQSLIGIDRLGLSHNQFALVMVLQSAAGVTASLYAGIVSDQRANRRLVALVTAIVGLLGSALMVAFPTPLVFVLAVGLLLPAAGSLFGQTFALNRLASIAYPHQREAIQSIVRSAMSIAFLIMLGFWTIAFAKGASVMSLFVTSSLASLALVVIIARHWPKDGTTSWQDRPSGLRLSQALRQLARPTVSLRLLCMGAVASSGILYMAITSLVFEETAGRGPSDVALYFGAVAGWEVPFMLLLSRYLGHVKRAKLIVIGTVLYLTHLLLLPVLAGSPWVWVLPLAAGMGGSAMLILPISYYQDLMSTQPGTAAALMSLQKLVGDGFAAAAFAIGAALGSYGTVSIIGAGIAMLGAIGLWALDTLRPFPVALSPSS